MINSKIEILQVVFYEDDCEPDNEFLDNYDCTIQLKINEDILCLELFGNECEHDARLSPYDSENNYDAYELVRMLEKTHGLENNYEFLKEFWKNYG